jgi:hypothetical protein
LTGGGINPELSGCGITEITKFLESEEICYVDGERFGVKKSSSCREKKRIRRCDDGC